LSVLEGPSPDPAPEAVAAVRLSALAGLVAVGSAEWVRGGRVPSASRRKERTRWRITGKEAAMMVRAGSMKPEITRGKELSGGGG
jgi:hypothetical protein